jgi:hypothetical protein
MWKRTIWPYPSLICQSLGSFPTWTADIISENLFLGAGVMKYLRDMRTDLRVSLRVVNGGWGETPQSVEMFANAWM